MFCLHTIASSTSDNEVRYYRLDSAVARRICTDSVNSDCWPEQGHSTEVVSSEGMTIIVVHLLRTLIVNRLQLTDSMSLHHLEVRSS